MVPLYSNKLTLIVLIILINLTACGCLAQRKQGKLRMQMYIKTSYPPKNNNCPKDYVLLTCLRLA